MLGFMGFMGGDSGLRPSKNHLRLRLPGQLEDLVGQLVLQALDLVVHRDDLGGLVQVLDLDGGEEVGLPGACPWRSSTGTWKMVLFLEIRQVGPDVLLLQELLEEVVGGPLGPLRQDARLALALLGDLRIRLAGLAASSHEEVLEALLLLGLLGRLAGSLGLEVNCHLLLGELPGLLLGGDDLPLEVPIGDALQLPEHVDGVPLQVHEGAGHISRWSSTG